MENFVKRFVTSDEKIRVSIYQDDCAENPRYTTDEPIYFEDYCRDYSLMSREDRRDRSYDSLEERANSLLAYYGDGKKVVDLLIENGKHLTDGKSTCNNALVYNKSDKVWELLEYTKWYGEKEYKWRTADDFVTKREELDGYLDRIAETILADTLEYLFNANVVDDIRIATYNFGYNGEVSFDEGLDLSGDGLCWIVKKEYLKYTGLKEDRWNEEKVSENWVVKEIEKWSENEVYGFEVEKRIDYNVTKVCTSEEKETENYTETNWETIDSCWGFYGEGDEVLNDMLDCAGYTLDELTEVDE